MLTFLALTILLAYVGVTSSQLFYLLMAVAFAGAFYTVYELPHSLTRVVAAAFIKRKYKVDVVGFDHLPMPSAVCYVAKYLQSVVFKTIFSILWRHPMKQKIFELSLPLLTVIHVSPKWVVR